MLAGVGYLVTRRSRLILVISGLALVVAAALGIHAPGKLLSAGYTSPTAPSQVATDRLRTSFGGGNNLILLVQARSGNVDSPSVTASGERLTTRLAAAPHISNVFSYWSTHGATLRSRNGSEALVVASLGGDDRQVSDRAKRLVSEFSVGPDGPGPISVRAGGYAAASNAVDQQIAKDLKVAEGIAIPVTALLLVLAFGSVVAALLPVALGVVSIFATLFVLWVLGSIVDVSIYAVNLTTALGLGLGIDYALLMVNRYREELAKGSDPPAAVRAAVLHAGHTIVFSAATVAAALAALTVFPVYFLRSFAYAGISVVIVSTVAALLVLPALLTVLGERVNALSVPWGRDRRGRAESPFWRGVARRVMARPLATGLPVIALLVLVGVPFLHVQFGTPDDRVLPTTSTARQVGDALRSQFPGDASNTVDVVTSSQVPAAPAATYSRRLSELTGVLAVVGPAGTWIDGTRVGPPIPRYQAADASWFSATISPDAQSPAAATLVHEARALPPPGATTADAGGLAAQLVDQKHDLGSRLPLALILVILTTFIVLFLFTGSVVLPVKALVLNALNLTAVFGVVVWIFQYGHLSHVLDFTPGPTSTTMPILLFCIAFGLSMDYEVFLLSRIKELHDAGATNEEAVAGGLARTGRIVTTAAALLAVTFLAFGLSKVSFIQLFGIGTALAILLDATLIRGVLVPAFMRVAGPANWWAPGPLRRLHTLITTRGLHGRTTS